MLPRGRRRQLMIFAVLTVVSITVLGTYYLRLPALVGIGRYSVAVALPSSGGLYPTANVTFRGSTIGTVTSVEPVSGGVRAVLSLDDDVRVPGDVTADVHSISAVGEQYLELVADDPDATSATVLSAGQTITKSTVPQPIGPLLDATNRAVDALPQDELAAVLKETSTAVGGIGPTLQRLVDSAQALGGDLAANADAIDAIIDNSGPLLDSQVSTGAAINTWARNVRDLARQAQQEDDSVQAVLQNAAPTADQLNTFFGDVREALPQVLANTAVVFDMLKRYHAGLEQGLVFLPQGASIAQAVVAPYPNAAVLDFRLAINQPPPCMTGFLPASEWRSPAETTTIDPPVRAYCKIPKEFQGNVVRGARNYPCADVPGKRAASPEECRSDEPYRPTGTNPWYGDPEQVLSCPAPAGRCDQPVRPGIVVPAPSVNNGRNPAPADALSPSPGGTRDPVTAPRSGTTTCTGQQPNSCTYVPADIPSAMYDVARGQVTASDGTVFSVSSPPITGDEWKGMLAPAG
ncbi:MAG: MlaD family protein [Mycobacterium kyogaense]|uniref:MlaD family protein n=1 Tax=Mycobacterium kyogaense TaxID=2212479 RepID=UPI002FFC976B